MSLPMEIRGVDIVVIPAYQPSGVLLDLVKDVIAFGYGVIVVDDGSSPDKRWIFEKLKNMRDVVVLHHIENMGKGAALKTAFLYIRELRDPTTYIVTMDADGQHLPDDMEHAIMTARLHPGSLILGVRDFDKDIPLRSKLGNKITRTAFHIISRTKVTDTQTGLRAFDYSLLDYMLQTEGTGYEYEMNMLLHCQRNNIPIVEIPIKTVYLDRENSSSHFHPFRDSLKIFKTILKFASSSLASFALDYVLFMVLAAVTQGLSHGLLLSNIIARLGSGTFNYLLNRNLVFKDKQKARKTFLGYLLLAVGILLANNIVLSFYAYTLAIPVWLAKVLTEITLFLISMTVQTKFIFKKGIHHKSQKGKVKKYDSSTSAKTA